MLFENGPLRIEVMTAVGITAQ